MAEPRLTCVVVAFHRAASLRHLLGQLQHPAIEIVVVNVEDDADVAAASAGLATMLPLRENNGYAAAVNHGVATGNASVVAFMNDDVAAQAEALLALVAVVESGRADVCVPAVLDDEGCLERTIAQLPTPWALVREWLLLPDRPVRPLQRWLHIEKWRVPERPERITAAAAVLVVAQRQLLVDAPLPEEYFLYWEESEWFWRLRAVGATIEYEPHVRVSHHGGRADVRPEKSVLLARNAVRCVRRTQGRRVAALAWPVVVLWNVRLVIVDALRGFGRRPERRHKLRARVAGLGAAVAAWREV